MTLESEELYSLIYQSTVDPKTYDDLIAAWMKHLDTKGLVDSDQAASDNGSVACQELAKIGNHLQRAEVILDQIGRTPVDATPLVTSTMLEFLVSEDGRVVEANDRAEARFGGSFSLSNVFDACDADSGSRLKDALHDIRKYREGQFVTLVTLPGEEYSAGPVQYLAVFKKSKLAGRRNVLLIRSLTVPWTEHLGIQIAAIFHLTPAETELCHLLATGQSLSQIARLKDRSIETIRVQLKAVFRKTYSKSQAELVRTILTFSIAVGLAFTAERDNPLGDAPDRIKLPDGRKMSVRYFGDEDGAPVLFLHGMMDAFGGPELIDADLRASGLKFICPARPGFGKSESIADTGQTAKRRVVADIVHLANALNLKDITIVGHLSGAAYAYTLAAELGSRAVSMLNISGAVPVRSIGQIRAMSVRQKVVALTAKYWPDLLAPLLRIGMSQIDSADYQRFLGALYVADSFDRDLIERRNLQTIMENQYRWSVSTGYEGFRLDASIVTSNWFKDTAQWQCPTTLLHGTHDPVVSFDTARTFADELPDAEFTPFESSGHLLLYQFPDQVIDAINRRL